jgi:putative transposase
VCPAEAAEAATYVKLAFSAAERVAAASAHAVQAPTMNAICERLIGTLRRELLDRTLILDQAHLRAVVTDYQEHYNTARPHQGIDRRVKEAVPAPRAAAADPGAWQIRRKPVLSGLINEYEQAT